MTRRILVVALLLSLSMSMKAPNIDISLLIFFSHLQHIVRIMALDELTLYIKEVYKQERSYVDLAVWEETWGVLSTQNLEKGDYFRSLHTYFNPLFVIKNNKIERLKVARSNQRVLKELLPELVTKFKLIVGREPIDNTNSLAENPYDRIYQKVIFEAFDSFALRELSLIINALQILILDFEQFSYYRKEWAIGLLERWKGSFELIEKWIKLRAIITHDNNTAEFIGIIHTYTEQIENQIKEKRPGGCSFAEEPSFMTLGEAFQFFAVPLTIDPLDFTKKVSIPTIVGIIKENAPILWMRPTYIDKALNMVMPRSLRDNFESLVIYPAQYMIAIQYWNELDLFDFRQGYSLPCPKNDR